MMGSNKKKKIIILSITISLLIITIIVYYIFNYKSINNDINKLVENNNGKMLASANLICTEGGNLINGTCYKCDQGTLNTYDKKCYANASYDSLYCAEGEYYDGYCVRKTGITPTSKKVCDSNPNTVTGKYITSGTYVGFYECYKIYSKAGKYNCSFGNPVTSIRRSDTYYEHTSTAKCPTDSHEYKPQESNKVSITFDAGSYGTFDGKKTVTKSCTITSGEYCTITSPKVTASNGYEFDLFYSENDGSPNSYYLEFVNVYKNLYYKDEGFTSDAENGDKLQISYKYYLNFDSNGGILTNYKGEKRDRNYTYCDTQFKCYYADLYIAKRDGYNFIGWYTDKTNGTVIKDVTKISTPMTIYAHWSKTDSGTQYVATFDANGGSTPSTSKIKKYNGSVLGQLPTTSRTGYTFNGWYTSKTDGYKINPSSVMPSNDITYYAHWTKNNSETPSIPSYTATFNANGGSTPSPSTITKKEGEDLGDLPTTSRTGYTFKGWYTAKTGGSKISSSMPNKNVTYYAQWTINKHKVTYKYTYSNGAEATPDDYRRMNCKPTSTLASYNITTWVDTATHGASYQIQPHWWTCEGYVLTNWNEKVDGTGTWWTAGSTWNKWGTYNGDTYDRDVTLYAQWEPITYTIKYHGNGGTYQEKGTWTDPRKFNYEEAYPGSTNDVPIIYSNNHFFYNKGYKFTGWKTKAGYTGWTVGYSGGNNKKWRWYDGYKENNVSIGIGDEKAHQLDLYAQWEPITYTIRFDKNANDAVGTMNNVNKTYGVSTMAPLNEYTREGYVFTGWNTKSDGTGLTTIADGEKIGTLTANDEKEFVLYAQWEIDTNTIDAIDGKYIIRKLNDTPSTMKKLNRFNGAKLYDNETQISDKSILKTGNKLTIDDSEYIISISGDSNKNGKLDFGDITRAYKYYKNQITTKNEEFYASDIVRDNEVNQNDMTELYNMFIGGE